MEYTHKLLMDALRCSIRGVPVSWNEPPEPEMLRRLFWLAREQSVLPLLVQAMDGDPALSQLPAFRQARQEARMLTLHQARRTADFLLVLKSLTDAGLHPAVLKGAVCRALYPEPEQRASTDEDLLIAPEDYPAFHEALQAAGLQVFQPKRFGPDEDELPYVDRKRDLYIELHMRPFAVKAEAYADCNRLFADVHSRLTELPLYGVSVPTLRPDDHLLYLFCHAYKHILYGGVGVRQICDICLFSQRYGDEIDWDRVLKACTELGIEVLCAAFLRIGQEHLSIPMPRAFADMEADEMPLLRDCLAGGVYGAEDLDRRHSSSITLDAVAAHRSKRKPRGLLRAVFPSGESLVGRFPYLRQRPWLLPLAWTQRLWHYAGESGSKASKSLSLGKDRIRMLRQYHILP